MLEYLTLIFKSIFVENMIFATFLGMCSYLAVSKKVSTAIGLGAAVVFVQTLTVPMNWLLNEYILKEGALRWLGEEYANYDLSFLTYIFIYRYCSYNGTIGRDYSREVLTIIV